ncbi:MAG: Cytochrome c4 [uncultured Thiotrichaceae bacterium]|uniref:Cytochrome c4 n=1 Tax=uncultured Thiotrichaceae bacterium TaxID=298394 RepID=A0A6S6SDX3_9GAMM|nr:MAG: Cytochrome c4 [uncultured Thiotrichaceae bacterium]
MKNKLLLILAGLAISVSTGAFASTEASKGGDAAKGKEKSAPCAACHGADGNSVNPEWPKIAGQSVAYITKQLEEFRSGKRANPLMTPQAANLSDEDIADLAAYFSSNKAKPGAANAEMVDLGRKIYKGGILSKSVAACSACHGPTGMGNPAANYPRISGQHAKYVGLQLTAFKKGHRANDNSSMMRNVAANLSEKEIEAVSEYIAGLR